MTTYMAVVVELDKDGVQKKVLVEPETFVARNDEDARNRMILENSEALKDKTFRVLLRPF